MSKPLSNANPPFLPWRKPGQVGLAVLLVLSLPFAYAQSTGLQAKFSEDFYASRSVVDAARNGMSDRDQMILSSFLLRVRLCQMDQGVWLHRGLTIGQAMAAERELLAREEQEKRTPENAICTLPRR